MAQDDMTYTQTAPKCSYEGGASPLSLTNPDINNSCKWVRLAGESEGDAPKPPDVLEFVIGRDAARCRGTAAVA